MFLLLLFKGGGSVFRRYNLANLLTWSEQFDNAAWVKSLVTVTPNAATAPDGNNTADKLVPTSATDSYVYQIFPATHSLATFSVWLKSTGADRAMGLQFSGSVAGPTYTTITVTAAWQRFSITASVPGDVSPFVVIGGNSAWVLGEDIYAWGAQLIRGSSAGPYQPRTT